MARAQLDQLLALQISGRDVEESADLCRWNYLLHIGMQLQEWGLVSLAVHLWRNALAEATAFDRQATASQGTLTDLSRRLVDLKIATASDHATEIASLYKELGEPVKALLFYQRAIERDPNAVHSQVAYVGPANMEAARHDWPADRRLLFPVFRHSIKITLSTLARYLCAAGPSTGVGNDRRETNGFPLTFLERAQLLALIHESLDGSDAAQVPARVLGSISRLDRRGARGQTSRNARGRRCAPGAGNRRG